MEEPPQVGDTFSLQKKVTDIVANDLGGTFVFVEPTEYALNDFMVLDKQDLENSDVARKGSHGTT